MDSTKGRILTVNCGSARIKFGLFEAGAPLRRMLVGNIAPIGSPDAVLSVKGASKEDSFSSDTEAPNHVRAVKVLMDWVEQRIPSGELVAVGHRLVQGGPRYSHPQRITPELIRDLHQLEAFDPEHLPEELLLTEAFHERFPKLMQVACFDTSFHRDMPRVARLLPIPR